MSDEELDTFVNEFERGTPTPPVNPTDIRRVWEFISKLREDRGLNLGRVGLRSVGRRIHMPETSVGPLWVRVGLLDGLVRSGAIKTWTPGSRYEKRLFEIVARFPVRVGDFDEQKFLRQIRQSRTSGLK